MDARQDSGTVTLRFQTVGSFSLQAVDFNDPSVLLQETPTFDVELAPDPASSSTTTTTTKVFTTGGIVTERPTVSGTATTTATSTAIVDTPTDTPVQPSSSSQAAAASTSPKTRTIIIVSVVLGILLVLLLLGILFFIKRRQDKARRHTFHREMMTRDPDSNSTFTAPRQPSTGDIYVHGGSSFEIISAPSPTPWTSRTRSLNSVFSSDQDLISHRPPPPPSSYFHGSPPGGDHDRRLARASITSNSSEIREKMRDALDKLRRARRSGQEQFPSGLAV